MNQSGAEIKVGACLTFTDSGREFRIDDIARGKVFGRELIREPKRLTRLGAQVEFTIGYISQLIDNGQIW